LLYRDTDKNGAAKMKNATPSMLRQQWLESCVAALRGKFKKAGFTVPEAVRVSIGFPKGGGGKGRKTIGQCWGLEASGDKHSEIFISPELGDGVQVFDVVAHELAHATVGVKHGHKKPFKLCAEAVGLTGKMTATVATPEFKTWAKEQIERIGKFPHAKLNVIGRKKQSTRLLKCICPDCEYTARVTRKWIEAAGSPICPADKVSMACDDVDGEESE
jgi:hypothetical protein